MFFAFAVNLNRNQSRAVLGCLIPISCQFLWKSTWNLSRPCAGVTQTNPLPCFHVFSIEIAIEINLILSRAAPDQFPFVFNWNSNVNHADFVLGFPKLISLRINRNWNRNHSDSVPDSPTPISFHFHLKSKQKSLGFSAGLPQNNRL